MIRQVTEGDYSFPPKYWSGISPSAVDLVKKLMTVNPSQRLSAADALRHEWMDDTAIVEKAEKLMDTQRVTRMETGGISALNGILPEEWTAPVVSDNSSAVDQAQNGKRPHEEDTGQAECKRVRH